LDNPGVVAFTLLECVHIFPFTLFLCYAYEKSIKYFKDFVGIFSTNPHKTLLVNLGEPRGVKV